MRFVTSSADSVPARAVRPVGSCSAVSKGSDRQIYGGSSIATVGERARRQVQVLRVRRKSKARLKSQLQPLAFHPLALRVAPLERLFPAWSTP